MLRTYYGPTVEELMETAVQVQDEAQAHRVNTGMSDASCKAFVEVCGVLKTLSDDEARRHVLHAALAMYEPIPRVVP